LGALRWRRPVLIDGGWAALPHHPGCGSIWGPASRAAVGIPVALIGVRVEPYLAVRFRIVMITVVPP
jgi:hypothetical protein